MLESSKRPDAGATFRVARTRGPRDGWVAASAVLLVGYGLLVLAAAVVGVRREAGMPTAPAWTVLHLIALLTLAVGLSRGWPWAWWAAMTLAVVELLALLPLVLALLGGPGITLLVPRLDLVLVGAETAALLALLASLWRLRPHARADGGSAPRPGERTV